MRDSFARLSERKRVGSAPVAIAGLHSRSLTDDIHMAGTSQPVSEGADKGMGLIRATVSRLSGRRRRSQSATTLTAEHASQAPAIPFTKGYGAGAIVVGACTRVETSPYVYRGGVKAHESEGHGQAAEARSVYSAYDSKSVYSVLSMAPDRVLRLHHVTVCMSHATHMHSCANTHSLCTDHGAAGQDAVDCVCESEERGQPGAAGFAQDAVAVESLAGV